MAKRFIYVYKTAAGKWADFNYNKSLGGLLETVDATDPYDARESPGTELPERVRALADRLILELPRPVPPSPAPVVQLPETFFGRMKWLFTGQL